MDEWRTLRGIWGGRGEVERVGKRWGRKTGRAVSRGSPCVRARCRWSGCGETRPRRQGAHLDDPCRRSTRCAPTHLAEQRSQAAQPPPSSSVHAMHCPDATRTRRVCIRQARERGIKMSAHLEPGARSTTVHSVLRRICRQRKDGESGWSARVLRRVRNEARARSPVAR